MRNLLCVSFILILLSGCALFDSEDVHDFGTETDHFLIEGSEEQPLNRNRNFINVEFTPGQDLDALNRLLNNYNLSFANPSVNPADFNYKTVVRVRDKPAEEYYTRYGSSSSLNSFGNDPGVVFALPIYELPDGGNKSLTNQLLLSFDESLSEERKIHLLDSLKTADHLAHIEREWLGDLFLLQVDKNSPRSSLDLSNHYQTLPFIKTSGPNFGYSVMRH